VPELRLLGYHERRPMLRVVRLGEAAFEAAPVSLDTGYALDECVRRDGWIVFTPDLDVWGVPVPFGAPPFAVAPRTGVVAAGLDPRTVWLRGHGSAMVSEYDGIARSVRRELELPAEIEAGQLQIRAETERGFILGGRGLYEWEPGSKPRLLLDGVDVASVDSTRRYVSTRRRESDELVLFDLQGGSETVVTKREGARWSRSEFSPDGRWLAIDLDYSRARTREEDDALLRDVITARARYEPQPHRLAIIRCSDGAMTIAEGEYDNFPYPLVWSLDSEWLVFSAPFQPRGLWLTHAESAKLQRVKFGGNAPCPLCDISDLLP
jgi:hypothetical protein